MNCQEFESRIETLAHGALADARDLREAAAHEESCDTCAALLADARSLSTGLRALASGMKGVEAPARVESALLAAFRARAASEGKEDSSRAYMPANVIPLNARVPVRQWSWVKTAAVASLAAAASLALFVLIRPGASFDRSAMIEPPPGALGGPTKSAVTKVNSANVGEDKSHAPEVPDAPEDKPSRSQLTPRPRAMNASYSAGGRHPAPARPGTDTRAQEVATEFIPLGQYAQAEEGHLVRVELPRSALASFGLHVNAEASAGGRVKADVLLGEDGTARAIRFIR